MPVDRRACSVCEDFSVVRMGFLAWTCRLFIGKSRRAGLTSNQVDLSDRGLPTAEEESGGKSCRASDVCFVMSGLPPKNLPPAGGLWKVSGRSSSSTRANSCQHSPLTQASTCEFSEEFPPLDADEDEPPAPPLVAAAHTGLQRALICEGVFFQGVGEAHDGGKRMVPAVLAEAAPPSMHGRSEESSGGPILFFGPGASTADTLFSDHPFGEAASPEGLYVDCRATPQDDPDYVPLMGARVCHGRVKSLRLLADTDAAEGSVVICDVAKHSYSTGVDELTSLPLAELVSKLREVQCLKSNAALEQYQRALCARSMAARRRQFLGVPAAQ